jgi:hypothetical protein
MAFRVSFNNGSAGGNAPLTLADNVAPSYGGPSNYYQNCEFRINNTTISRIGDYVPQIDVMEKRLTHSGAWLRSTGSSTSFLNGDFEERLNQVALDGFTFEQEGSAVTGRTALGYDEGIGAANSNQANYTAADGIINFVINGGAVLPDANAIYSVGEYFEFIAAAAPHTGAALLGHSVPMKILEILSPTQIRVEAIISADIGGAVNFQKRSNVQGPTRRSGITEMLWQPPLSIFKNKTAVAGGSTMELVLNPHNLATLKQTAVEVIGNKTAGIDYDFVIDSVYLYIAVVTGPRYDNLNYLLDLTQTNCQGKQLANANTGLQKLNFEVASSTSALTVCFQDSRNSDNQVPNGKLRFDNAGTTEKNLTRFYTQYAQESRPSPDADPSYDPATGDSRLVRRYTESILQSGTYFSEGGSESYEEYLNNGMYMHMVYPRDGVARDTRATVNVQFSGDVGNTAQVLVMDHHRQVVSISNKDGRTVEVRVDEV